MHRAIVDTTRNLRTLTVGMLIVTFLATGCRRDVGTESRSSVAELGPSVGYTARISVPDDEPASIGIYEGGVTYPDGRSFEISGKREGTLSGRWLADLGGNAAPELILWIVNAGSGSYASIHIHWLREDGPALQDVSTLPPNVGSGYSGHDSVFVENGQLKRCFPVDEMADSDEPGSRSSGQKRCLAYNTMAGWVME